MVSVFPLLVGGGATLGLWQVMRAAPHWQASRWVNFGIITLISSLLGARLLFVLFSAAYFASRPLDIPQVWMGGLSWSGALLGGVLAIVALSYLRHIPLPVVADRMAPMVPPLAIAVWIACWQAGCAYGPLSPAGMPLAVPAISESGEYALRFPLQPAAASTLLAYFVWLESRSAPFTKPGQKAGLTGLGLSLNLLVFSFFRADSAPLWAGLRPDSWSALLFAVASIWICFRSFRSTQKSAVKSP